MSFSGMQYHDSCPPPPGVDCDHGYAGQREREQRERDRMRRHDHRFRDYPRMDRDERYGGSFGDRSASGDVDYRDESSSSSSYGGRRSRYDSRRSGDECERDDRRGYRDHDRYRDGDRDRTRDRSERDRDRDRGRERDRDHSRDRDRPWERDRERGREDWREEIPNSTIMIRGLSLDTTESEIRNEVTRYGLQPKDVRLMRKRDSGGSRGFAFVEFHLLSEAVRWKELTQGVVFFDGHTRSTLHYSIPKDGSGPDRGHASKADWTCGKCGVNNFKRRELCFKCNAPREEPEIPPAPIDGGDEVGTYPSNTLLFRNLDVLTTEERVLSMLGQLTMLPIKSLRVAKDSLTNTSRGFAFVELHSTSEATQLHDLLVSMNGNFFVDGRQVTVSYARRPLSAMNGSASASAASAALAAAQWTNQGEQAQADAQGEASALAGQQTPDLGTVLVDGVAYKVYPVPDMSTYRYEQSSGYYYDPATGLYYDANSRYYYNSETQQYLYWDGERRTYLPAPSSASTSSAEGNSDSSHYQSATTSAPPVLIAAATVASAPPKRASELTEAENATSKRDGEAPQEKGKVGKQEKVKIAKKIAKDMEKWAKTLNQKKENAKLGLSVAAPQIDISISSSPSSADAGFAVLEKRTSPAERSALMAEVMRKASEEKKFAFGVAMPAEKPSLVAAYGGESDSEPEGDAQDEGSKAYDMLKAEELKLTDWSKLACLMCKRQFPAREALLRHQQLSDLHKQNMETLKLTKLTPRQVEELDRREREAGYRDRAKERREKFGQPDEPPPNRLKNKYLRELEQQQAAQPEQPTKGGIGEDNIGNKMLKAMGWSEGQGLGKSNQGMSGIIEVQQRAKTAGLGMKGSTYGATAGDSYKDAVKKAMQARFKEISEQ